MLSRVAATTLLVLFWVGISCAQHNPSFGGGGAAAGPAGGDLSGTYPNPTVAQVHPSSPITVANGGVGLMQSAPFWLRNLGDGSEGVGNCNGNLSGEHRYTTFSVSAGNTCTVTTVNQPLVIHATGACTIDGTIIANGVAAGFIGFPDAGGSGGGGGGGAVSTGVGAAGTSPMANGNAVIAGGTAGAAGGGAGGNGLTPLSLRIWAFIDVGSDFISGGAHGGPGGSSGGAGGNGGQAVLLECNSIEFSGTIDVRGANGVAAAASSTGAGGGGGGGYVIFSAVSYGGMTGSIYDGGGQGGNTHAISLILTPQETVALPSSQGLVLGVNNVCIGAFAHVATLSGTALSTIAVDAGGSHCTVAPTCTVSGGGGTGGTCACTVSSGAVNGCSVVAGGNGYTITDYTTSGTGGWGAAGWVGVLLMQ